MVVGTIPDEGETGTGVVGTVAVGMETMDVSAAGELANGTERPDTGAPDGRAAAGATPTPGPARETVVTAAMLATRPMTRDPRGTGDADRAAWASGLDATWEAN